MDKFCQLGKLLLNGMDLHWLGSLTSWLWLDGVWFHREWGNGCLPTSVWAQSNHVPILSNGMRLSVVSPLIVYALNCCQGPWYIQPTNQCIHVLVRFPGPVMSISPFIRHWEAAKFDVEHLREVNSRNLENRKRRRRRRDVDGVAGGGALLDHPQEAIRMNFTAHDRWVRPTDTETHV